jgi:hypothetical protein
LKEREHLRADLDALAAVSELVGFLVQLELTETHTHRVVPDPCPDRLDSQQVARLRGLAPG